MINLLLLVVQDYLALSTNKASLLSQLNAIRVWEVLLYP